MGTWGDRLVRLAKLRRARIVVCIGVSSRLALAQAGTCEELGLAPERVVYGAGGPALTPTLALVASALAGLPGDETLTVLYADALGACGGYDRWRIPTDEPATFKYWSSEGVQATCTAPFDRVDFAHLPHGLDLCAGDASVPEGAASFLGPVRSAAFVVADESPETSISAEAAYLIYGFGAGAYDIAPWDDPEKVLYPGPTSSISLLVGAALGVPAAQQVAVQPLSGSGLLSWVSNGGTAALGFTDGRLAT